MFTGIIEILKGKSDRGEESFTIKELTFLFDQILLYTHLDVSRDEIRASLENAILSYDWYEEQIE